MSEPATAAANRVEQVMLADGHRVTTYSYGKGEAVLLLVSGGPGLSCDYLRDSHAHLAGDRLRVVAWDQLGTGASDRPDDPALWTISRSVEELETVRRALGLGAVHLLGQSFGAFLAVEYALSHPEGLRTLILEGGAASIPHLRVEQVRQRDALGAETAAMMQRHEAEGTLDHPEYKAALDILAWRHLCRLQVWPDCLLRSIEGMNHQFFETVQGPTEFVFTGNLRDWDRLDDLHRVAAPTLILCGQHDAVPPSSSHLMRLRLPQSRLHVIQDTSHTPFLEQPAAYFAVLEAFLDEHAP